MSFVAAILTQTNLAAEAEIFTDSRRVYNVLISNQSTTTASVITAQDNDNNTLFVVVVGPADTHEWTSQFIAGNGLKISASAVGPGIAVTVSHSQTGA
jgi:hypothetical protein